MRVNLLINEKDKSHILIKNMSRLVRSQLTNDNHAVYMYDYCLQSSTTYDMYKKHISRCRLHGIQRVHLPQKGDERKRDKVFFSNTTYQLCIPFVIYADFESILPKIQGCSSDPNRISSSTTKENQMVACSFATYIVSPDGIYYKQPFIYVGEHAAEKFLEHILPEVLD